MSTFDNAIAAHAAHGAGACADPLTDSLAEQCTQPVPLRPGWEHEPAEPPVPWRAVALVVVFTVLASALLAAWSTPTGPGTPATATTPTTHPEAR